MKFVICSLVMASTMAVASPAVAQQTPASESAANTPPDANVGGIAEIVVTAQRREQKLQDVPIAISVIGGERLSSMGIAAAESLVAVIPGLTPTRQLKGTTPFIRGIGTQGASAGLESPVATYIDDVYYMNPVGNAFSFNNIQRIEVLKGPQGTLFGRNTTGGLIHIITRDPKVRSSVEGSFSYGNYDTREGALYLTGGAGDVAVDFAGYLIRNKGFGRNLTVGGRVNKVNETAVRGKLLWTPGGDTRVTLSADYANTTGDLGLTRNAVRGSRLLTGVPLRGAIFDTSSGFLPTVENDIWGASLKIQHKLGVFNLQSVTAYRKLDAITRFDQDAVPANFGDTSPNEANTTFQQEFIGVADLGRLNLTVGGFYFHALSGYNPLGVRSLVPANNYDSFSPQKLDSYAAFAQATYVLTDQLNVTGGVRYTIDKRRYDAYDIAVAPNPLAGTILRSNVDDATFKRPTWRASVDYKATRDVLLYASYNRGFKSGVFNSAAIQQPAIDPEVADAFEVGMKSDLLNRQLRFNVSAFRNVIKGIQLTRVTLGSQFVFNAAKGRAQGLEIEAILAPRLSTGNLELTGSLALMDTKYVSFAAGPVTVPQPAGGNATVIQNLAGRKMIRSPDWTLSLGASYSIPIGSNELGASALYYHSDGFFWEPDNRLRQAPYDLVNAQGYFAFGSDKQFRVLAFAKNLTNEEYFSYVSAGGLGDLAAPSAPRTYGVGFNFKF